MFQVRYKIPDIACEAISKDLIPIILGIKNSFGTDLDKWLTSISRYKISTYMEKNMGTPKIEKIYHLDNVGYYVSIEQTLRRILDNRIILNSIMNDFNRNSSVSPSIIERMQDGSCWRGKTMFQKYENFDPNVLNVDLRLIVHIDGVSLSQGLSRKQTTNMSMMSYILDNLSYRETCKAEHVTHIMTVQESYTKNGALQNYLNHLASELLNLASKPIVVIRGDQVIHFRPRIEAISADNKAKVQIAEYLDFWGKGKCCWFCWSDKNDFFDETSSFVPRDKESLNQAIKKAQDITQMKSTDRTALGITGRLTAFSIIPYFDICTVLTVDLFHDWTRGVMEFHFQILLNDILLKNSTNRDKEILEKFMEKIKSVRNIWQDGCVSGLSYASEKTTPYISISGTGYQKQDLFLKLVQVIDSSLRNGEAWNIYIEMREIHALLFSRRFNKEMLDQLQLLTRNHYLSMKKKYPKYDLKPKAHFIIHASAVIERHGPLYIMSTARGERYLNYAKNKKYQSRRIDRWGQTVTKNAIRDRMIHLLNDHVFEIGHRVPERKNGMDDQDEADKRVYDPSLYRNPKFKTILDDGNFIRLKSIEFRSVVYKISNVISSTLRKVRTFHCIEEIWLSNDSDIINFVCVELKPRSEDLTKKTMNPITKGTKIPSIDEKGFVHDYYAYCVERVTDVYELIDPTKIEDHHVYETWAQGSLRFINKINHEICETKSYREEMEKTWCKKKVLKRKRN